MAQIVTMLWMYGKNLYDYKSSFFFFFKDNCEVMNILQLNCPKKLNPTFFSPDLQQNHMYFIYCNFSVQ